MSATDSSSSSEPSPRQPDDAPWAKPEEFEAKKGIITHLYDLSGRNLTLKETMRIMEVNLGLKEQHGFYGTAKMYKSRISKWKLRKNLKPAEVIELVRQYKEREAAGKSTHVYFRGERMDQRRVREYLRLVHGMSAGSASEKRIKIEGITCRTPSPSPTAPLRVPMPQVRVRTPDSVREPDRRSPALQTIVAFGFESGFWRRTPGGRIEPCAAIKSWYRKTLLVNRALQYGRMQLGFRLMQQCFDDFTALMRNHHPFLWIYTHRVAIELAEQSPEAAQSFARLACNLSQALNHSTEVAFDQMLSPDPESSHFTEGNLITAREISEFYRHLLMKEVGLNSFEPRDDPRLPGDAQNHQDVPRGDPSPNPPQVEDMRRKEYHAWRTYYNGYHEPAAQLMRDIGRPELIEDIEQYPDALFAYHDTAALLAMNRSSQEEIPDQDAALGACRTLIDFSTHEYGLASLQTIDALADLETHLRRRQQQQNQRQQWDQAATGADGVLQEIHAALDLLDYQTDPDLVGSSVSYTQRGQPLEVEWADIPIDPALSEMG
ncbi:hypothetical protein PG985_009546 [Apiospora marii]|uniref:uncharacterized protein n=1 Tax=Apiospora marii TaxID=335849 RepID=UPI00312F15FB